MPEFIARLFLITPVLTEAPSFVEQFAAALSSADVACVLVRHGTRDDRAAKALLRELASVAQLHGAALLVDGDPRLAAHVDADGVHMDGIGDDLAEAIERMKPDRIVGCGSLQLRDEAMTAGEGDIDYVMFGEPDRDGALPTQAETLERVQWWAEIFNVPCVGFAQTLADVTPLAEAGAEFIALGDAAWGDPRGAPAALGEAVDAMRAVAMAARAAATSEGAGA
ncbi:thiamine phosphate synthase [Lichenihabitans sp. PAMC28606]|uniref:thiamine phosphate synthase n=1 Tax=Lichenihabitans sp. PAMC28606 TaxID=2880932 RepID=UPI001D09BEBC|nr:thiamine phosphate synthase [Lichenihabitans sp. PAMC28606]UDL96438.1 thiamine phosphate synthase [Lichenihabitans sp. PAMC28606]